MSALDRHLRTLNERRTDRSLESFERQLTCIQCSRLVALFEAAAGATTEEEHRFTDPQAFVCASCLDVK